MARPKPLEDRDEIALRPPLSVGKKIRELAANSGMGAGPWCVEVLKWAIENGISVSLTPTVSAPDHLGGIAGAILPNPNMPLGGNRLNEDPAPYGSRRK